MYDTSWYFATFPGGLFKITVIYIPKHRGFWMSVLEKDDWLFIMQLCSYVLVASFIEKNLFAWPPCCFLLPPKESKNLRVDQTKHFFTKRHPFLARVFKDRFLSPGWSMNLLLRCWTWDHEAQVACYLYSQLQKKDGKDLVLVIFWTSRGSDHQIIWQKLWLHWKVGSF